MSNFVVNKDTITERLLSIVQPDFTANDIIKTKFSIWWNSNSTGLRLTYAGVEFFNKATIEYFDFDCNRVMIWRGDILLKMDKHILCPYYLSEKQNFARVYDSRIASLINLHGNIIDYVNSLDIKTSDLT